MRKRISGLSQLLSGFYALYIYLPFSDLARRWRRLRVRIRGKQPRFLQATKFSAVSWRKCTAKRMIKICEAKKANGNIRVSELAILAIFAAEAEDFTDL